IMRDIAAKNYAQGSVLWAIDLLTNNWKNKKQNQLVDIMPVVAPAVKENDYIIKTRIDDMQSRFNLNNLKDPAMQPDFAKLIQTVDKKTPQAASLKIAQAVTAWILQA